MATQASIKVVKSMAFKGGTKLWSNRYHFTNSAPSGTTPWTTLSDAVVNAEKAIFNSGVTIVETFGYAAGSDVPVFSKTYSTNGTGTASGSWSPGECVALLRYSTTQRTSKNHPVYLFNYYHAVINQEPSGHPDLVSAGQRSAIGTYAASWVSGFSDGSVTHIRCGPNGAVAQAGFVEEYVTHRDFPYSRSA